MGLFNLVSLVYTPKYEAAHSEKPLNFPTLKADLVAFIK
jgi:hypothetical protein